MRIICALLAKNAGLIRKRLFVREKKPHAVQSLRVAVNGLRHAVFTMSDIVFTMSDII